ncbi:MAG: hypothetical protein JWM74_3918 [Myxococcaceae bacterium]|nr:hypothetical protein [Myxococcaceae bacterium]
MPPETKLKRAFRVISGLSMVTVGILHFVRPSGFVKIVPAWLPAPFLLVLVSGFFEIAGGIGLFSRRLHRAAAFGLIALYIAVFPANVNMAVHDIQPDGGHIPTALLWLRLPFQAAFIALAWWLSRSPTPGEASPSRSQT